MPAPEQSNGRPSEEALEQGVLSNLPRTRPQRATERRIASRNKTNQSAAAGAPADRASRGVGGSAGAKAKAKASTGAARKTRARAGAASAKSAAPASGASTAASAKREEGAAPATTRRRSAGAASAPSKRAKAKRTQAARKPRARSAPAPSRARAYEPAPRQGFEAEGERASGPVQPPGGAELVTGAAEIVGEIAKAGVSAGERVLRDVLSRLRP